MKRIITALFTLYSLCSFSQEIRTFSQGSVNTIDSSFWSTGNGNLYPSNTSLKVGIGTDAPYSELTVGNVTPANTSLVGIYSSVGTNTYFVADNGTINTFMGSDGSGTGILGTLTNHDLVLRTNNIDAIHIATNQNVGIGTASPNALLDVVYNNNDSRLYFDPVSNLAFDVIINDGDDRFRLDATNNIIDLHVNNGAQIYASGTDLLLMRSGGNVGIGNASPALALDVVGNGLRVTDNSAYQFLVGDLSAYGGNPSGMSVSVTKCTIAVDTFNIESNLIKIIDGTEGDGKVLTSNSFGYSTWQGLGGSSGSDIPAYTSNALAVVALGAGKLYYTDVAGEYFLKVTH